MECNDCGNEIEEGDSCTLVKSGFYNGSTVGHNEDSVSEWYCRQCYITEAATRRVELLRFMGRLNVQEHVPYEKDEVLQSLVEPLPDSDEVIAFTITKEMAFDMLLNGYFIGRAPEDRVLAGRLVENISDWDKYYDEHNDVIPDEVSKEDYARYNKTLDELEDQIKQK